MTTRSTHANRTTLVMATLLGLGLCRATVLPAAALNVGDPAPKLQATNWVQGDPVKEFEAGKVYIVEFWATWCGPCRVSIPHLNELHTKFKSKGLVAIGQDVWEDDPSLVAPFVKSMGDQMTYRVALDTVPPGESGRMAATWMEAAGQDGIPTAFVVDQRARIAWIGHPMELKESLLDEILAGRFDLKKSAAEYALRRKKDEQMAELGSVFQQHRQKEEWDQAEAALAKIEQLLPEDERDQIRLRRFGLLLDRKDYRAAYRLAGQLSVGSSNNASMQNSLAWEIATRVDLEERDLELAETIARRGDTAAQGKDAEIVDTLARVLFLQGRKEAAIELERKAVELAEGARKEAFRKVLASYQEGQLPLAQRLRALWHQFSQHRKQQQWDQAESALGQLEKLLPEKERGQVRRKRLGLLLDRKDYPNAETLAVQLGIDYESEPMALNQIAWEIAIRPAVDRRALEVAEKIARQADAATKGVHAEVLDTLARVLFLMDQSKVAVELQEKAVALAKGRRKDQFQQTLDSYRAGKTPEPY